ncbi:phosphosulfolactate synthase [Sulfurimonas aquatica]|uniref:Phosphosulfolactate synthase n=2 Tax=Sulfurimonas aquatica TaxID=2672570 RepID=A0A975GDT4_9BACT|nr:phosphosulfolactate synthase [Sulfurimonas aquatica]
MIIDTGYSTSYFKDLIESFNEHIDFVKFGWGTCLVSPNIDKKIEILKLFNIDYFFGGTLFEYFYSKNQLNEFVNYCNIKNCKYIEVSNGTIDLSNTEKASIVSDLKNEFNVFSEVGYKDNLRSTRFDAEQWINYIKQDIDAGATKVIIETRESGKGGICNTDGSIKEDVFEKILASDIDLDKIIFEAPTKFLQQYFINNTHTNVNLGNIDFNDIISLETLRHGLRSDTFFK